ncbi:MAG: hypothetical protein R3220_12230 [Balneolaceae bacterium]|nr:hypothetical protein [Balneolaceae bacterium]
MKYRSQIKILIGVILIVMFSSCGILGGDDDDSGTSTLGGDPSPMGAVGHEFGVVTPQGVDNENAVVISNSDGISTIEYTATISNPVLMDMVKAMPDVTVNGNQASVARRYRITTKGFQSVYDEGNLTIMNYDAKPGDTYSMKRNGTTLKRQVTKVSKEDEYPWGFMMIKTIHVEETGRNIPGVSKVEFVGNHRWGMVGMKVFFEDGSTQNMTIIGQASNE